MGSLHARATAPHACHPHPLHPHAATPHPYRPGTWDPPYVILGESHKGAPAQELARTQATLHRTLVRKHMSDEQERFRLQNPLIVPTPGTPVPSSPGPFAASDAEQVSRMEGPVRCVKWHPKLAVLASAASAVAMWTCPA